MAFIAGPYSATFGGKALGKVQDGFRLTFTNDIAPIVGDNVAGSIQDGIYRGGNCFISAILSEWNAAAVRSVVWPYHATFGSMGLLGRRLRMFGDVLVLTKMGEQSGQGATNAVPRTLTANVAVLAPGFPLEVLLSSRPRFIPIRLQLLPYSLGGTGNSNLAWFQTS